MTKILYKKSCTLQMQKYLTKMTVKEYFSKKGWVRCSTVYTITSEDITFRTKSLFSKKNGILLVSFKKSEIVSIKLDRLRGYSGQRGAPYRIEHNRTDTFPVILFWPVADPFDGDPIQVMIEAGYPLTRY